MAADDANGLSDLGGDEVAALGQPLMAANGLKAINGLSAQNGLTSVNGLSAQNGLKAINGLSSTVGLMTSAAGRDTVSYLVRCALSSTQSITKKDQFGIPYTYKGEIGIAPEWADGACDITCQESVSACMLAHVNTSGHHISLWLDGNVQGVGWGQNPGFPYEEGSFFGNLFVDNPKAYYCNGKDFDQGVVPGRLGANQAGAPYTNPWGTTAACAKYCTAQDIPNQNDGYKACYGLNHVITVWRNFDPSTPYKICNGASGLCLDTGDSIVDGGAVVQKAYKSTNSQKWKIIQVNPKQYEVVNVATGKALAVALDKSGAIVQSTYLGGTDQLWSFTSMANSTGSHAVSPVINPGVALSLPNASSGEGQPVQQRASNGNASFMRWTIGLAD